MLSRYEDAMLSRYEDAMLSRCEDTMLSRYENVCGIKLLFLHIVILTNVDILPITY